MKLIYSLEKPEAVGESIFLAGPTMRISDDFEGVADSWRNDAIKILQKQGFDGTVFIPEFKTNSKPANWSYSGQVDWEGVCLNMASVIVFWIPRDLKKLPAFTTNIEFGEWINSGKIVVGAPSEAPKNEYLKYRAEKLGINWNDNLELTMKSALIKINEKTKLANTFFTSDTHFKQERTLELSKRPFMSVEDMDNSIVRGWNSVVTDESIVFHLGDFGDPEYIFQLKGKEIFIVPGNYDKEEILLKLLEDPRVKIIKANSIVKIDKIPFKLIHSIDSGENAGNEFFLFGHTHGRSIAKRNGLDVGIDAHHFKPIDAKTILFYYEAIMKHYDENVFSEVIPPNSK